MDQQVHNLDNTIKSLTKEELDRLFHIFKDNADIFDKIMPNTPFVMLIKAGNIDQAYAVLHAFGAG